MSLFFIFQAWGQLEDLYKEWHDLLILQINTILDIV